MCGMKLLINYKIQRLHVEVWKLVSNHVMNKFIPHFELDVITYSFGD